MPRPPNPENERNPLRLLRSLLSQHGEQRLITVAQLSEIIGVPANTIRAIQNDQRGLTNRIRNHIVLTTGASWSDRRKQWRYVYLDDNPPFSRERYLEFQRIVTRRPPNDSAEVARLMATLRKLFDKIPDKHWHRLFFRFQDFIDKCRVEIEELPESSKRRIGLWNAQR